MPAQPPAAPRTNWAQNYTYSAPNLLEPQSVAEIQSAVRQARHLRILGSRHSFNGIADDDDTQLSPAALQSIDIDSAARTVTVGAGVRYGDLAPVLDSRGFAFHNLASLPHISVAGAIATATHGSGTANGNLATAVVGFDCIAANGELIRLSRAENPRIFPGAAVHLGALGVLTSVTLNLQPSYQVAQTVYLDLPFAQLERHLVEIFSAGYSVSLFTDWQQSRASQVWIKRRADHPESPLAADFYGAHRATVKMHPILGHPADACTDQLGIPGPWYERLPHFRMDFIPSSGRELQTEYFVPLDRGYEAIRAVETLRDRITPLLWVTELRTVAADDLWMSMAHQRPSLAIHFTWKPEWPAVRDLLPAIEAKLAPFAPRPHWAKLFTLPGAALAHQYPRLADFKALAAKYDPSGKFRNDFLRTNLYSA